MAWEALVTAHTYIGEHAEADRAARHARALIEQMGSDPAMLAEILNAQAFSQVEQSNFEPAVALIEEAVRTASALGENHHAVGTHLASLGTIYTLAERNDAALEAYDRAYAILLATYGPEHPQVAHMMLNLGRISARLDQLDMSNEWYERALAIFTAVGESDNPVAVFALNNLGQNYGDQGNYAEAIPIIERAIDAQIRNVGESHRWLVRMRRGLAEVYLDAGDHAKAIAEGEHALRISEATFGDEHDETASTRRRLGEILLGAGERDRALPLLQRALEGHSAAGVPADHLAVSQYWLFRALKDDPSEHARARALAESAIPVLDEGEARQQGRAAELRAWLAGPGG